jgi:aryl-alcohol dehydrogenase-like predicted oxidoreductase
MEFNLNRRKFLAALSAGTAHVMFANPLFSAVSQLNSADPMQMVKLGKSGLQTTLLGFGSGVNATNRSSALTRQDKDKSIAVIRHAYDRGMRMIDTADAYGSHQVVGEAMKKMDRSKIMLTSKIWVQGGGIPEPERPDANIVIDRFRKELNTDYIDLIQVHLMTDPKWTDTWKKQMDILSDLKAKGVIKAHGVSVHSLEAMKTALASPWVDVIHVRINPYGIAMDKNDPAEVVDVINQLHASGKGVIGMKLIGAGRYSNDSEKIDNAIKFVLGLGSVDMMIIGFQKVEEVDDYIARVEKVLKAKG